MNFNRRGPRMQDHWVDRAWDGGPDGFISVFYPPRKYTPKNPPPEWDRGDQW